LPFPFWAPFRFGDTSVSPKFPPLLKVILMAQAPNYST
jgi:hypothetical protein